MYSEQCNIKFSPLQIYEAVVEEKGKNFIFLRLSGKCVKDLQLTTETEFFAHVSTRGREQNLSKRPHILFLSIHVCFHSGNIANNSIIIRSRKLKLEIVRRM